MSRKYVSCLGVADSPEIRDKIEKFADCEFVNPISNGGQMNQRIFEKSDALIVGGRVKLTKEILEKFQVLKLVVVMAIGTDNIDLSAARINGITVCTTPACSVEEVADSTLSLILCLYRQTFRMAKIVADGVVLDTSGKVKDEMKNQATRILGQTLGIIGFGNIGETVALRAQAFGFCCVFFDPIQRRGIEKAFGMRRCESLEEILSISDCITLHCPLISKTHHIINEQSIQLMKHGLRLVNTSRGPLVNEQALSDALKSGTIRGAALDVHEKEPFDSKIGPLKDAPNLISTPHCSWYSDESDKERRTTAAEEVERGLNGTIPNDLFFPVN